ncbi:lipoprotein LpqV [Mycolicibacterium sp. XJ1819]
MRLMLRRGAATVALAGLGTLAACSSSPDSEQATSSAPTTSASAGQTPTAAPGAVDVSPGGVTTAVGAPAQSTEEEYFKACKAAKDWMDSQGGDPTTLIEPYLQTVQSSDSAGPGTFETPWSQLAPERQAAVIVAAQAAAEALCG